MNTEFFHIQWKCLVAACSDERFGLHNERILAAPVYWHHAEAIHIPAPILVAAQKDDSWTKISRRFFGEMLNTDGAPGVRWMMHRLQNLNPHLPGRLRQAQQVDGEWVAPFAGRIREGDVVVLDQVMVPLQFFHQQLNDMFARGLPRPSLDDPTERHLALAWNALEDAANEAADDTLGENEPEDHWVDESDELMEVPPFGGARRAIPLFASVPPDGG
jgi:hypothetical protein